MTENKITKYISKILKQDNNNICDNESELKNMIDELQNIFKFKQKLGDIKNTDCHKKITDNISDICDYKKEKVDIYAYLDGPSVYYSRNITFDNGFSLEIEFEKKSTTSKTNSDIYVDWHTNDPFKFTLCELYSDKITDNIDSVIDTINSIFFNGKKNKSKVVKSMLSLMMFFPINSLVYIPFTESFNDLQEEYNV